MTNQSGQVLSLEREFKATREQLFDAWTNPELLVRWFGPVGCRVESASMDVVEGGKYNIVIVVKNDVEVRHFGQYVLIEAPKRLVFTWVLADQECPGSRCVHCETLVDVTFEACDAGTRIKLTQEKLPNKAALDGHKFGWTSSLESLAGMF